MIRNIKNLEKQLQRFDESRHIPPDLVGFYGEIVSLLVLKKKFESQGYRVVWGHGQSRADITLEKDADKIKIEVKTSRMKPEWYGGNGYGVALNVKPCLKHPKRFFLHRRRGKLKGDFCYFDFLLFVALGKKLEPKFYVFPRKFLLANERYIRNINPRFSSASHRIVLMPRKVLKPDLITGFDRRLGLNRTKYRNNWKAIT